MMHPILFCSVASCDNKADYECPIHKDIFTCLVCDFCFVCQEEKTKKAKESTNKMIKEKENEISEEEENLKTAKLQEKPEIHLQKEKNSITMDTLELENEKFDDLIKNYLPCNSKDLKLKDIQIMGEHEGERKIRDNYVKILIHSLIEEESTLKLTEDERDRRNSKYNSLSKKTSFLNFLLRFRQLGLIKGMIDEVKEKINKNETDAISRKDWEEHLKNSK